MRATDCRRAAVRPHGPFGAGLTLVETVVASALLVVAMVPMFKALGNAHSSTVKIEHKTASVILARSKLDQIRAKSIYHYADSFSETGTSLSGSYLCNVTDDCADPLRMVTVVVGYDDNADLSLSSDEVEVVLSTLIARRWPD